jgi:hypothetical protein
MALSRDEATRDDQSALSIAREIAIAPDLRPNEVSSISRRHDAGLIPARRVWAMLFARIGLAIAFQALFAVAFAIAGDDAPWRSAADWWLASLAAAEFVNLWLLSRCARLERLRLRDLYNLTRNERGRDLRWTGLALAGAIPLALIPTTLLASLIWSDPEVGQTMLFRPIWTPMAWGLLLVFPMIHAATELPTYYGYVLPRLQVLTKRAWLPLLLTASVLSVQHSFLPLLFDTQYLVWRALMFLPLAMWLGWMLQRRPTSLPYMAGAHGLLDLSLPIFVLIASISP